MASQCYAQHRVASSLVVFGYGPVTSLRLSTKRTITYTVPSGSPPVPDTLLPGPAKQLAAPGQTTGSVYFDDSIPWLLLTVTGSLQLSLLYLAYLDTIDSYLPGGSSYALLARFVGGQTLDWEPN
jgi:hypothetical protein